MLFPKNYLLFTLTQPRTFAEERKKKENSSKEKKRRKTFRILQCIYGNNSNNGCLLLLFAHYHWKACARRPDFHVAYYTTTQTRNYRDGFSSLRHRIWGWFFEKEKNLVNYVVRSHFAKNACIKVYHYTITNCPCDVKKRWSA